MPTKKYHARKHFIANSLPASIYLKVPYIPSILSNLITYKHPPYYLINMLGWWYCCLLDLDYYTNIVCFIICIFVGASKSKVIDLWFTFYINRVHKGLKFALLEKVDAKVRFVWCKIKITLALEKAKFDKSFTLPLLVRQVPPLTYAMAAP